MGRGYNSENPGSHDAPLIWWIFGAVVLTLMCALLLLYLEKHPRELTERQLFEVHRVEGYDCITKQRSADFWCSRATD